MTNKPTFQIKVSHKSTRPTDRFLELHWKAHNLDYRLLRERGNLDTSLLIEPKTVETLLRTEDLDQVDALLRDLETLLTQE